MSIHPSGSLVGLIVGAVLTTGGWCTVRFLGKPMRDQAAASVSWPHVDGQITRSQLVRTRDDGKTMYSVDIAYAYEVDGRAFEGHRAYFGDSVRGSDPGPYRREIDRHPVGRTVHVHHDPTDPGESVLEPGVTWSVSFPYFLGIGLATVGGLLIVSAVTPLLLVAATLAGGFGRTGRDPRDDFGPSGRSAGPGGRDTAEDDGIRIG